MRVWLAAICLAVLAACAGDPIEPAAEAGSPPDAAQSETARGPDDDYRDALAALEGGPEEQRAAEPLLRRAAEAGHVEAQFLLGLAHHTGRGAPEDPAEAARWYRAAAEAGHRDAAYLLGLAYWRGRGVAQDDRAATRWFARAAAADQGEAAYHLALAHMLGRGVERDDRAALRRLQKAAEQGVPEADYLIGVAYTNGRGVERDDAWAARFYGRAAQAGLPRAQYMMAVTQALGLGLPRDLVQAYAWARLATAAGDAEARSLAAALKDRLSEEEKEAAERLASGFRPATDRGPADAPTVRFVQLALHELGFNAGPIDGFPGPLTFTALADWQRAAGLNPDGKLSDEALLALKRERLQKRG